MGPQTLHTPEPRARTSSPPATATPPAGPPRPANPRRPARGPTSKVIVPVRYAAWLGGDLGRSLERTFAASLEPFGDVRITRLPRAWLVEAEEEPGPLLEAVHRAIVELEAAAEATYPVLHHEMGPLWTGTLQAVFA